MSFGDNKVLSDVSFHINDNEKCAIVGINGVGKTTLLKIIMGEENPDSGDVIISKDKSIGYLKQQQDIESERTIYEEMRLAKQHIFELEARIRNIENEMKTRSGEELERLLAEYNTLMTHRADMHVKVRLQVLSKVSDSLTKHLARRYQPYPEGRKPGLPLVRYCCPPLTLSYSTNRPTILT